MIGYINCFLLIYIKITKARTYNINGEASNSKLDMISVNSGVGQSDPNTNANTMILADIDLNSTKGASQLNGFTISQEEYDPLKMEEFSEDPFFSVNGAPRGKIQVGKIEIFDFK
jgi:hypothetical protein